MPENSVVTKRHAVWFFNSKLISNWSSKKNGQPLLSEDEEYVYKTAVECIEALDLIEEEIRRHKKIDLETRDSSYNEGFYDCCEIIRLALITQRNMEYKKAKSSVSPFYEELSLLQEEIETKNRECIHDDDTAALYANILSVIERHKNINERTNCG